LEIKDLTAPPTGSDTDIGGLTITAQQREAYERDGFLVLGRITTDEELEWLRGVYDRLFAERAGEEGGGYFDLSGPRGHTEKESLPQILEPEKHAPELRETMYFRNARRIAATLLGVDEGEVSGGGHMIYKPPRYGRETPWHQDEAYWTPQNTYRSLSLWMPLDDASVESGCMQFIPGSHRDPIRRHRHIDNDPTVHGLVTDDVDAAQAVPCPIPAGAVTVHHLRTLHYAGPNTTGNPRRAYILVMNAPHLPAENPDERPWLLEEQEALEKMGIGTGVGSTD